MLPLTDAQPTVAHRPEHTVTALPTHAAGSGLTVTTTVFVAVHPVAVIVSVNV